MPRETAVFGVDVYTGRHQVRAQAEADRKSRRLRDEEAKLSTVLKRLRSVEHRGRILETGAVAARQRAEAGSRKVRKACIFSGGDRGRERGMDSFLTLVLGLV